MVTTNEIIIPKHSADVKIGAEFFLPSALYSAVFLLNTSGIPEEDKEAKVKNADNAI